VREGLVFEIADREFDDGVLAMLGLHRRERIAAVRHERKQLPRGQQFALAIERADATNHEPSPVERRFGDLRDARGRVVLERRPRPLIDLLDRRPDGGPRADADRELPAGSLEPVERLVRPNVLFDQNPESARSSFGPVAPARVTRAMSSSQKRSIPREVFAEPLRQRTCSTSPVSARVASNGW